MIVKFVLAFLAFLALSCTADVVSSNQVVCYYDSKGSFRSGAGNYHPKFLAEAAGFCTHLVYGYAAINKQTYELEPMNPSFDVHQYKTYQEVLSLKTSFPGLKILLSVGGGRDADHIEKYLTLLEYPDKRHAFVSSAIALLKKYGFDGLDMAWQFPPNKPKVVGFWGNAWSTIKYPFVSHVVDPKSFEHKQQFVQLVSELKKSCRNEQLTLSLSVLPNVNSTLFFNIPELVPNLDMVNLWAFDFYTPERNPKEADLPAPLYEIGKRFEENGEYLVEHWCLNGAPRHKLFLGIPTFARTWKTTNPAVSCLPPITEVCEPGAPGVYTKEAGLLSYMELYPKLSEPLTILGAGTGVREGFTSHKYAAYGLIASSGYKHRDTWVGYEDPDTAKYKATYARLKGLGGVAIVDLTLDDFKGVCGRKYPILSAVAPVANQDTKIPLTTMPSVAVDYNNDKVPPTNKPSVAGDYNNDKGLPTNIPSVAGDYNNDKVVSTNILSAAVDDNKVPITSGPAQNNVDLVTENTEALATDV